jgi:CubicO group peptidase (beta-lactamase class C family)
MRIAVIGLFVLASTATAPRAETVVQWGTQGDVPVPKDFDLDGLADYVVWRPSGGTWFVRTSVTDQMWAEQWGQAGDVPVPGDYDADGVTDYAVWRPSNGIWYVKSGLTKQPFAGVQWGQAGDVPVPGDYDADGYLDYAVWRPSTTEWFVKNNAGTATWVKLVGSSTDLPIGGDYDGIPGDDYGVFHRNPPHAAASTWLTIGGTTGMATWTSHWILNQDRPTAARLCSSTVTRTFWRSLGGLWTTEGQPNEVLGQSGDIPVPADYAGDWSDELAVWRPSDGTWHVEASGCDRWLPVRARMLDATAHARGVAVAAVKDGAIVFAAGAGMANDTVAAGPDVPWQLASLSKLFIGTSIMTLVDAGTADLDVDTGLASPRTGLIPTLRQFMNHTATVSPSASFGSLSHDPPHDLSPIETTLADAAHWLKAQPGAVAAYSNTGAAWGARFLEIVTGVDFADYTQQHIFAPLGMTSTGWFMSDFPSPGQLAIGYWANGTKTDEHGVWPYAMGNLRSTANDLARFMIMWTTDGGSVLSPTAVQEALQVQGNGSFGVSWAHSPTTTGRVLWAHSGALAGVCNWLHIDPVERDGVVILTNGPCSAIGGDMYAIYEQAFGLLDRL